MCVLTAALYMPVLWMLDVMSLALLEVLTGASFALTWILQHRRWYTVARFALWVNANFFVLVFASVLLGTGVEYYFFPGSVMCLMLFRNRHLMLLTSMSTVLLALAFDQGLGGLMAHVSLGDSTTAFRVSVLGSAMFANLFFFWIMYDESRTSEQALHQSVAQLQMEIRRREILESELRDATLAACSASEAKTRFLANMSHEIRTPLSGVIGLTELALDTGLDQVQRGYLTQARESAEHLLQILNGVLDLSKIEAGRLSLEEVPIDVEALVHQVIGAVAPIAQERGLHLHVSVDVGGQSWRLGDPLRLRQVLLNLLNNALKFTERGQVSLTVAPVDRDRLNFEVRDTGIGMSKAQLEQVFEAFVQAEASTSRRYGGTGLGLAICRELVELFGGRIEVESKPGLGSVFWFTAVLPARDAAARVDPDQLPEVPSMRILLAEDNRVNQLVARKLLEKLGHDVTVVGNGRAAVEQAQAAAYDVILMDLHMPELDGLEATRQLRRLRGRTGRVPVFALTADALEGARARCLEAGMNGHMSKPLRANEVRAMLAGMTRSKQSGAAPSDRR
jgi:signal transduction histidine kinase/CheY-like chemotaxis protein